MAALKDFTFHDAETSTGNGSELPVINLESQMLLDIASDASTLTVNFEVQGLNGNWLPYTCVNMSTFATATSTTASANEIWQVDLLGASKFRARISVQTGGTGSTIKGRVVS